MATATTTLLATAGWQAPAGVNRVKVECWGGGGGGSYTGSTAARGGGGGGGGGCSVTNAVLVIPGKSYTVTVAAQVAAQTAGNVSSFTGEGGTSCLANGGSTTIDRLGGAGGVTAGAVGDNLKAGGPGGSSANINDYGGGGGGESAGPTGTGNSGQNNSTSTGGAGGTGRAEAGDGGKGGDVSANGALGVVPGGGGGGAGGNVNVAGVGAAGWVRLTWTVPINIVNMIVTSDR